jgi:hypothetical protein
MSSASGSIGTCRFRAQGDVLLDWTLSPSLRDDWVAPSTNFAGTSVTCYVNGQKSRQVQYENGKHHGEFIAFNSDGSKSFVQHYEHQVAEGTDTGYYPSGPKILLHCRLLRSGQGKTLRSSKARLTAGRRRRRGALSVPPL